MTDLAQLAAQGAVNAGGHRCRRSNTVTRSRSNACLQRRQHQPGWAGHAAAEILGGRKVGIRIETDTIMFYDLDTRELLRVRPNPLSHDKIIPAPREPARRPTTPTLDGADPSAAASLHTG